MAGHTFRDLEEAKRVAIPSAPLVPGPSQGVVALEFAGVRNFFSSSLDIP
jgi:hypothetical protein